MAEEHDVTCPDVPAAVRATLSEMMGRKCSLQRIDTDGTLRIGFGVLRLRPIRGSHSVEHAEWEIGTYYRSWRVCHGVEVLCGGQDPLGEPNILEQRLNQVDFGTFKDCHQLSAFDVRIRFSTDVYVDVLGAVSNDDEIVHLFSPNHQVTTFSIGRGWQQGPSNKPWG